MTQSCASCLFFALRTSPAFPDADGMCRRRAPQGVVIGSATKGWQVFPPMNLDQWCGDYVPNLRREASQAVAA